jgi:hypothetical protein
VDGHGQHFGDSAGGTERQLYVCGGSGGGWDVQLGGEFCVLGLATVDERGAWRTMRVQSNNNCGWGGDDWSYSDNLDLWAEIANAVPAWDGRGRSSLHGHRPTGRERPSLREHTFPHFAILHTRLGGDDGDCGGRAKESRQDASLRRDHGDLPGAWIDGADFLRRSLGQWQHHNTGDGESANGDCVVC